MDGKRSKLWTFFSQQSENKAKCDLCLSLYSVKGGSTANLKKHLISKHRPSYESLFQSAPRNDEPEPGPSTSRDNREVQQSTQPLEEKIQESTKKKTTPVQTSLTMFTKKPMNIAREKKINDLILKLIVKDLQPFSVVEDSGFRDLISYLEPNYKMPSRYILSNTLLDAQFILVKEKVKDELKRVKYVCLTTDGWTSRATTSYQAVTAHYILGDTWELRSALLGCFECNERHTASYIKDELLRVTTDWEIKDKVFVCVTDNAANMKAAIRLTGWEHFACIAHTLNLIVRSGLVTIEDVIKKIKTIVEHFHRSPVATKKLFEMQEQLNPGNKPLKLIMDVVTRWNSTLDMIERVSNLQAPVEATIGLLHNPVQNLTEQEWQILPDIIKILKPFKQLTEEMSSENTVTISKVLAANGSVLSILNNLQNIITRELSKNLLDKLITEFNARFKNSSRHPLLSKSALLDPRFKKQSFFDNNSYESAKTSLKADLQGMTDPELTTDEEVGNEAKTKSTDVEEESIWMEFDTRTAISTTSTAASHIITMRQYIEEKIIYRKENPLKWWQTRAPLYPQLSNLAQKYLCVMATSVPSERIFSKSGQILSEKRACIKPKRMEKILFLNMNQRFF